ncbi:ROK family transcriptional regulator [Phycicoccus endophyticus]|nr:ROK family transcriptional regulator [Phycicoccus endophyticus]
MLSEGAGELVRVLRQMPPMTRTELGDSTGWARTTVNSRLEELLTAGLVRSAEPMNGARGRPASRFTLEPSRGALLVADVGASSARLARADLAGAVAEHESVPLWIGDGPDAVLGLICERLSRIRDAAPAPVWGVGISLPGPIDSREGRVVSPPIMTGWDGLAVPEVVEPALGAPVLVENDSNAMAWGEHVTAEPPADELIFVKVGTGVGAGFVTGGRLVRGAHGAAGDLGHTRGEPPHGGEQPLCRCGKTGCVEAYAGAWAIERDLRAAGQDVGSTPEVLRLIAQGNPHAVRLVRDAGRVLGGALAHAVSLLNPAEIVVGGQVAAVAGEHLLSGIREHVAARALPLATRDLRIRLSDRPHEAGITGMADATSTWILGPSQLAAALNRVGPPPAPPL